MKWIAVSNTLIEKSMHISVDILMKIKLYAQNVQPKIYLDVIIRDGD